MFRVTDTSIHHSAAFFRGDTWVIDKATKIARTRALKKLLFRVSPGRIRAIWFFHAPKQ